MVLQIFSLLILFLKAGVLSRTRLFFLWTTFTNLTWFLDLLYCTLTTSRFRTTWPRGKAVAFASWGRVRVPVGFFFSMYAIEKLLSGKHWFVGLSFFCSSYVSLVGTLGMLHALIATFIIVSSASVVDCNFRERRLFPKFLFSAQLLILL